MDHPLVMGRGQTQAELPGNLNPLVRRQSADPPQQGGEVFTVDELHGQERLALRLADVMDPADVRMRNLPGESDFLVQSSAALGVFHQVSGQELQRDRLTQPEIVRAIDLAHASFPQLADHTVAAGQHLPRSKAGRGG